mmetsp:Transcript_11223/g.18053  ORF Transcript_11223/g.18053 Transcript_11223/m.18053 type:complete len:226 (+) Transcript_11223:666-1343(+)
MMHMSAAHERSSGTGSHMHGKALRMEISMRSRISPGGMSHSETRRTSSKTVRRKGTRPSTVSGTWSDLMKCNTSTLLAFAPTPRGGRMWRIRLSMSIAEMVPLPSSNPLKMSTYSSTTLGDSFHSSCSCMFSKFSMMTAVNKLSRIMDTMMTKLIKNGYDPQDPQLPAFMSHAGGCTAQSFISPAHSSLVATRNSVSIATWNDSKLACSLRLTPRMVVPKVSTPT